MPWITRSLPGANFRYTRRVPCLVSSIRRYARMKPSALRILASSTLNRDAGMSTRSSNAWLAFRIRVSMSAIGSVIDIRHSTGHRGRGLPGCLDHARDLPPQGQVAETDAAHLELAQITARPSAD